MNLRIRTETGKRTVLIKVLVTDTIDVVYELIENFSETEDKNKFELRTNFPNKSYDLNEAKNLKDLGLAPSSVLIMRAKI